jgi:F0F1-type ATP synthase assembly protein I
MASEDQSRSWLRYSHLGIQFCLTFGLFTGLGMWADSRLATEPWLVTAGALLGMTAATYVLVKETSEPKRPGPPKSPPSSKRP